MIFIKNLYKKNFYTKKIYIQKKKKFYSKKSSNPKNISNQKKFISFRLNRWKFSRLTY